MDWPLITLLVVGGLIFLWWRSRAEEKGDERAEIARNTIRRDTKLYENIKAGMREYNFREKETSFWKAKDGELLFETAHLTAFHVDHFIESRVGFFIKETQEYGMWSGFAGNGDEFYESYYRTDRTFQKEERIYQPDDD